MSVLVSCQSLAKSFDRRRLFDGITLGVYDGDRVGLIGPNGSGKSTFLKLVAGSETPDAGEVVRRRDVKIAYVAQIDRFAADATVGSAVRDALRHHRLDEQTRDVRVASTLTRMGFADTDQPAATLSGGWKKRLAIARELVTEPDLLLLDEPTNHLDLDGIFWLEQLLLSARVASVFVSHDRYFLENVATRIVEINRAFPGGFLAVPGNYSTFLERREERLAAQDSEQQSLAQQVKKEIAWLKRGPKAQRTKNKSRITDARGKMADLQELKTRSAAEANVAGIEFDATERKTNKLLAGYNLSKTLGDKTCFAKLDVLLTPGTRLGILGPNGSGKSTLLRVLAGELPPDTGNLKLARDLKLAHFDQAKSKIDRDLTLQEALSSQNNSRPDHVIFRDEPVHITSWARRFLFRYDQLDLPVSSLSGGEQARIGLSNIMLQQVDVLLLDEPTNDLDIPSLEVLESALEDFPGALILVTHDRMLLDRLCTELLALDGAGDAHYFASLDQWQESQNRRRAAEAAAAREAKKQSARAQPSRPATPKKKLSYKDQKDWDTIEDRIHAAEADVVARQQAVDAAATHPEKLNAACHALADAQQEVERLYVRWAELEDLVAALQ